LSPVPLLCFFINQVDSRLIGFTLVDMDRLVTVQFIEDISEEILEVSSLITKAHSVFLSCILEKRTDQVMDMLHQIDTV